MSKIHIWFVFCKIISFSNYFIMKRFRFCFISYKFKISKYLMNCGIINYYNFKLKWMLLTVPISRINVICYIHNTSLSMFPKICR
nr:MAG TPA: hypothetical protein [Crassvirales sp.]